MQGLTPTTVANLRAAAPESRAIRSPASLVRPYRVSGAGGCSSSQIPSTRPYTEPVDA